MTIILTPALSALYEEGGWASHRIEETILEDLQRAGIVEPVVVTLDDGSLLFAVRHGEVI